MHTITCCYELFFLSYRAVLPEHPAARSPRTVSFTPASRHFCRHWIADHSVARRGLSILVVLLSYLLRLRWSIRSDRLRGDAEWLAVEVSLTVTAFLDKLSRSFNEKCRPSLLLSPRPRSLLFKLSEQLQLKPGKFHNIFKGLYSSPSPPYDSIWSTQFSATLHQIPPSNSTIKFTV